MGVTPIKTGWGTPTPIETGMGSPPPPPGLEMYHVLNSELTPEYSDLIGHGHRHGDGWVHVGSSDVSERFDQNHDDETHGESDLDGSRVFDGISPGQRHRALYGD